MARARKTPLPESAPPPEQPPRDISELAPAPYNPRRIGDQARAGLRRSLVEFGDISGITYNFRTGNLIAGHQRSEELSGLDPGGIEWGEWRETDLGRERWGEVEVKGGARFRVRGVDWPTVKEKAANVAANSQAIAGEFTESLRELLDELEDNAELFEGLRFEELRFEVPGEGGEPGDGEEDGAGSTYTRKIQIPIYEPKGPKPPVDSLVDGAKTLSLLAEIDAAEDVPDEVKAFLRIAAERHTVFNFRRIAEFYAHSPAPVQRLFEKSALVIIDFDDAIANGFVKLTEAIFDIVDREKEAAGEADAE